MARPLRILHTADSHVGADLPARRINQRHRRGDEIIESYHRVINSGLHHGIDLILHCGDVFDVPNPGPATIYAAAEPLLQAADRGIPVVVVPGNHERSAIPASLLFMHPCLRIVREPTTLALDVAGVRIAVSAFPCVRRRSREQFADALDATRWADEGCDVRILAVHQTFESAVCGPANYRFRAGEDVVAREAVPDAFHYVAAGHVHRHQTLMHPATERCPIVYCGSPDRVSFAEIDEPKGAVWIEVDSDGLRHRFVEHRVRPMVVQSLDISGQTQAAVRDRVLEIIKDLPRRSRARIRLTGWSVPNVLRDLRITTRARDIRPDVQVKLETQEVEITPHRLAGPRMEQSRQPFEQLDAPEATTLYHSVAELADVPAARGVYALFDSSGKLLYIGKAAHLRSRIRTHVRANGKGNHFSGWQERINRVQVRLAASDLEAMLIEADLVRRLRPPFNRQMRRWERYCYLAEGTQPFGQLDICRETSGNLMWFGPYRSRQEAEAIREAAAAYGKLALCPEEPPTSRLPLLPLAQSLACHRYYDGLCRGPCAQKIGEDEYAALLGKRRDLLLGLHDDGITELEARLEEDRSPDDEDKAVNTFRRIVNTLRHAFDHGATLRMAESMLGGMIILPDSEASRIVVLPKAGGLKFDRLNCSAGDAKGLLDQCRRERTHTNQLGPLPKTMMDSLCIASRELRRGDAHYRFIPYTSLRILRPESMLEVAFGPEPQANEDLFSLPPSDRHVEGGPAKA